MRDKNNLRVLHCNNDNKSLGGAYVITRRVDECIRRYGYQFDYFTMDEFVHSGNKNLDPLPSTKCFSARLRKNRLVGYLKLPFYFCKTIKKQKYKIVHIDTDLAWKALLYAIPARKAGSKVVVHSHSTNVDGVHKNVKRLFHNICKYILDKDTDCRIACTKEAAEWMFPSNKLDKVKILFNGVDLNEFYFDAKLRKASKEKLNIHNKIIIGNIAALNENKNQLFLVGVLKKLLDDGVDAFLVLAGKSIDNWDEKILSKAKKLNVSDHIRLLGFVNNTNALLNAIDIFALPSHFEGAPLSLIEAQATGVDCIISDSIGKNAIISSWVHPEPVEDSQSVDYWVDIIKKIYNDMSKIDRTNRKIEDKYSLRYMAEELSKIYDGIIHVDNSI